MTSTAVTTAAAVCTMSAACHQFKEMPKAEKDATKRQAEKDATKHQAEEDATKHQAEATKHQIEEGGKLSEFDFANRRVIDLRNEWSLAASVYRGTPP